MKRKLKLFAATIVMLFGMQTLFAQVKIGTNPNTINKGSILELESDTMGVLFPRVSIADTATWAPLAGDSIEGMTVYNKNATIGKGFYYWDGGKWVKQISAADGGELIKFYDLNDSSKIGYRIRNSITTSTGHYAVSLEKTMTPETSVITTVTDPYSGTSEQYGSTYGKLITSWIGGMPPIKYATGDFAFIAGAGNTASNLGSIALGVRNVSEGQFSVAIGENNWAAAHESVLLGSGNRSKSIVNGDIHSGGFRSVGLGWGNRLESSNCVALGHNNTAKGISSVTLGNANISYNTGGVALGISNYVYSIGETAVGSGNFSTDNREIETPPAYNEQYDGERQIFSVGSQKRDGKRNNSIVVLRNGKMGLGIPADETIPANSKPTEMLDVNGNARIRNIYTNASAANTEKVVVADVDGVLKTKPLPPANSTGNVAMSPTPISLGVDATKFIPVLIKFLPSSSTNLGYSFTIDASNKWQVTFPSETYGNTTVEYEVAWIVK